MDIHIDIDGIKVAVARKAIRNIHLRVHVRNGQVRMSVPRRMSIDSIRSFALSRKDWIRKHLQRIEANPRVPARTYTSGETHYLWGQPYQLAVVEHQSPPNVSVNGGQLVLQVRPGSSIAARRMVINRWHGDQLKVALPELISAWEPRMNVSVNKIHLQRMKTRWGSCNTRTRQIRFNTRLAMKPLPCVEYVVVHEMVHLLEPSHNRRFYTLMTRYMPDWKSHRELLNRDPVPHDDDGIG